MREEETETRTGESIQWGIDEGVRHLWKSQERETLEEISIYFQLAGITQSSDAGPGLKNAEGRRLLLGTQSALSAIKLPFEH